MGKRMKENIATIYRLCMTPHTLVYQCLCTIQKDSMHWRVQSIFFDRVDRSKKNTNEAVLMVHLVKKYILNREKEREAFLFKSPLFVKFYLKRQIIIITF
jgi:predicted transcriptional regulator